jgi:hypothetical protein
MKKIRWSPARAGRMALVIALSQVLLVRCTPSRMFANANEVYKTEVILYFRDHTKTPGVITIPFESGFNASPDYVAHVRFTPDGKTEEQTLTLAGISGYSFGSNFYALKRIDYHMNNVTRLLFVKRLTGENSKIQLYELYESGLNNYSNEKEYTYYLSLSSFAPLETINVSGSKMVPNFDQKMSAMVDDCPELAQKIRSKQDGYFLSFVSFNLKKQPEVLLRIINEYNNCPD